MLIISKQLEKTPYVLMSAPVTAHPRRPWVSLARSWKFSLQFFPTRLTARGSPNMVTAIEYK